MRYLLKKYLVYFLSIYFLSESNLGLQVYSGWNGYLLAAIILLIILLFKPLIDVLLFPVHLLTLNLTSWLIYLILIYLWSVVTPNIKFQAFNLSKITLGSLSMDRIMIPYWVSVIIMSLSLVIIIKIFDWILK